MKALVAGLFPKPENCVPIPLVAELYNDPGWVPGDLAASTTAYFGPYQVPAYANCYLMQLSSTPEERMSAQRVHQLLVLMRAEDHQHGLIELFREANRPKVVEALQTQCENAESFLAAGNFTEQQLWQALKPLVKRLRAALDANNGVVHQALR